MKKLIAIAMLAMLATNGVVFAEDNGDKKCTCCKDYSPGAEVETPDGDLCIAAHVLFKDYSPGAEVKTPKGDLLKYERWVEIRDDDEERFNHDPLDRIVGCVGTNRDDDEERCNHDPLERFPCVGTIRYDYKYERWVEIRDNKRNRR